MAVTMKSETVVGLLPYFLVALILLKVLSIYSHAYSKSNIPLIGHDRLGKTGRNVKSLTERMLVGYDHYCKRGLRCFRISLDRIILPPALFAEAAKLPEDVLSPYEAFEDMLHLKHTIQRNVYLMSAFVRQEFTRTIPAIFDDLQQELELACSSQFASDQDNSAKDGWRKVLLLPSALEIVSRLTCRAIFGLGLSQNPVFIRKAMEFSHSMAFISVILDWCPSGLRGALLKVLPYSRSKKAITRMMRSEVLASIERVKTDIASSADGKNYSVLEALTYRLLTDKNEAPKTAHLSSEEMVDEVTPRLLILMFAAFDTTALTLSHAILDLMYQDQEIYAKSLRAEAIAAIAESKKKWALRDLNRLELMDSFIKESQRLHPIGASLSSKKLIAPNGWTFSNNDHVPYGSTVALPTYAAQRDENVFPEPHEFRGFRFVKGEGKPSAPDGGQHFLAYGQGKHACPGRIFASILMKLVLSEVLLNYEYQPLSKRPVDRNLGNWLVPSFETAVYLRRKEV